MIATVPAWLIGLAVAAYWWRVLRMAIKARRHTGRAANLIPPEPLGRALRLIWAPAIALWVAQPFIVALAKRQPTAFAPFYYNAWIAWPAAIIVVACYFATRACWKRMGKAWRMGIDPSEKTTLIASGPFAYVRHPIYALSQLMMLTTVLALPSPVMIIAGLAHLVLLQWESHREETHLLHTAGERYAKYRQSVGRFIPRRARPYMEAENSDDAMRQA